MTHPATLPSGRVAGTMPTCCQYHADRLPDGCRQGRACPEHTRRIQEADIRWSREIGYESARPDLQRGDQPAPPSSDPWGWVPDHAGRGLLIYAGTLLASALAAAAIYINN